MNDLLEKFGFTNSEVKVYYALLELGKSSAGIIATKAEVSSSKVYEILERLNQKGLVSQIIESGVKYFSPADPSRIYDIVEERQKELEQQKKDAKQIIKELEEKQLLAKNSSEATLYRGIKGLNSAFYGGLDRMKDGNDFLSLGIPSKSKQISNFFLKLGRDIGKKNIITKILSNESSKEEIQYRTSTYKNCSIKYTSELFPTTTSILGDRVIIFPKENDKNFLVIVIDNKDIADSFRTQFNKLWEQDFDVKKGQDGVSKAFYQMLDELNPGEEYYVLGASWGGQVNKVNPFFIDYHQKREKKGVRAKLLFVDGAQKVVDYKDKFGPTAEIKFLPKGGYEGIQFNLYKNKILMFVWRDKEPVVFSIEDKKIYETFKAYFDQMWNQKTQIVTGLDAVKDIFEEFLESGQGDFIGARGYFIDYMSEYIDDWEKRAIRQGFTMRNIVDPKVRGHRITQFPFTQTKYTLQKEFADLSVIWIYGGKVVISNWTEKEPTAFIFDDKKIHDLYEKQFEHLWNQKASTYTSQDEIELMYEEFYENIDEEFILFAAKPKDKRASKFNLNWVKKVARKVPTRVLYYGKTKENIARAKEYRKLGINVRILNTEETLSLSTLISGDMVLNTMWDAQPTLFRLENKTLADSYKQNFNILWKKADGI
jgi:sugar-specific transcriptional regulator TrmB